jgi:putative ABC transport system permease protein
MFARLIEDLRFGARWFAQSPGFTVVAILTLALGIGANTAIFSVANALLFRPLPYEDPGRLVIVTNAQGNNRRAFSSIRARLLTEHSDVFSGFAPFASESFNLTGRGDPLVLHSARVAANFFDVLGVHPALGRAFRPGEDSPGAPPVAIISDSLWKQRFGADRGAIGQFLTLDSVPTMVVGVMPPDFEFSPLGRSIDVWSPRIFETNLISAQQVRNGSVYVIAIARLAVPLDQARAEMLVLDAQFLRENPALADADPRRNTSLSPVQDLMVAPVRSAVLVLFGAVGFLLLIACANIASLLLARAVARRKEIAIRTALGASRASLIRQLLTESVSLALIGGLLGTALSAASVRIVSSLPQTTLPRINPIRMDLTVLAFSLAASLVTGILFGLVPALQLARTDVQDVLRDESRGLTGGRWRNLTRGLLVVSQIAISMMLLIGAGLLMRSFVQLEHVPLGFNPDRLLLMHVALPPARYSSPSRIQGFYDRMLNQVQGLPGVRSAAIASALPLRPWRYVPVLPEGSPQVPLAQWPTLSVQVISPNYFETMGIPLLEGRTFTGRDNADAPPVVLINQVMVERYFSNQGPVGKHLTVGNPSKTFQIIGVTGSVKNVRLAVVNTPEIFYPLAQVAPQSANVIVRCAVNPMSLAMAVRSVFRSIDPDQPVTEVRTMEEHLAGSVSQTRLTTLLLAVFSIIALVVATVGLYGLISYSVAQRTQELGIRLALGAGRGTVLRMVMRQGLMLAVVGVVLGVAGSVGLTRLIESLLYQVSATDVWTFTACALIFVGVALIASFVPARRAAQLDPADALRTE